jgi:hypothetical protein
MRTAILAALLSFVPLATAFGQASPPTGPSISVSPVVGNLTTTHQLQMQNLPANASEVVVLFDPDGAQTIFQPETDATGTFDLTLQPPPDGWKLGLYRAALQLAAGQTVTATFVAGDGQPHLFADPASPSPTSAFDFVGIGLPPNSSVNLDLLLANGLGEHLIPATTDANGTLSAYAWPEQFGFAAFSPGYYQISIPTLSLSITFVAREHPQSASITVDAPVVAGGSTATHFRYYSAGRYLWGVYADSAGNVVGEILVGPTDVQGSAAASVPLGVRQPGAYYLATPYDWGETTFTVLDPTPTPTPTATPSPTATPHPKPTAKPTAKSTVRKKQVVHCKKGRKRKGHACKR